MAKQPGKKIRVPAYIVTFSDMVTLLLTFFVMLLSMSKSRNTELFQRGHDSFVNSIKNFGLGAVKGRSTEVNLEERQNVNLYMILI